MRKLLTLIRAGVRSNFGFSVVRHRLCKERRDLWLVLLVGVAALGVLPALYGLMVFVKELYLGLKPMGQEHALLTMGILTGEFFLLLFGFYYVISAFYFSRDLDFLIPMPIKPFQVMASKFAVVLINQYLTVMAIVLPILIGYGVLARGGLGYWVNGVLVYLFLPVIPLAIDSILVVVLMRIVNLSRKKDAVILIGSIILVSAGLGLQFLMARSGGSGLNHRAMTGFLTSPDSLLNRVGANFPPSIWATQAIAGGFSVSGLLNLALFAGVSLALFAAILVLAERLFYRGLVGLAEVSGRRRLLSRDQMSHRLSSGRHAFQAIFVREWRIMNRTPIFLLNGTLVVIIVPLVFVLMAQTGSGKGGAGDLLKIMTSSHPLTVILAAAALMTACGSLNGTAASTFSREGGQFWISRVIPVAPREQVAAKFLHSYLVAILGTITASVVAILLLRLKAVHLAAAAGLSLITGVLLTTVGMMIDLARPLLDWTNPQKAIKQNLNVLLAMLLDIGILTALFFGVRFLIKAGLSGNWILVLLFGVLVALDAASWHLLTWFAGKRYREIET